MTKNPIINAVLALLYIALIASILYYGLSNLAPAETVLLPFTMLSLFVLSAAVMAFLFLYQPVLLFLDGKTKEAAHLVIYTIGSFAVLTFLILVVFALTGDFGAKPVIQYTEAPPIIVEP